MLFHTQQCQLKNLLSPNLYYLSQYSLAVKTSVSKKPT
jgi:hypothetical protein